MALIYQMVSDQEIVYDPTVYGKTDTFQSIGCFKNDSRVICISSTIYTTRPQLDGNELKIEEFAYMIQAETKMKEAGDYQQL